MFDTDSGLHMMSCMPPSAPGDTERMYWLGAGELEGKVVSLEQLRQAFPADEEWEDVKETPIPHREHASCTIFVRTHKKFPREIYNRRVGYRCNDCKQIIAGAPRIDDDTSILDGMPLAGREGYDVYCRNCHACLYEQTIRSS